MPFLELNVHMFCSQDVDMLLCSWQEGKV